jgi:hypothetical protein
MITHNKSCASWLVLFNEACIRIHLPHTNLRRLPRCSRFWLLLAFVLPVVCITQRTDSVTDRPHLPCFRALPSCHIDQHPHKINEVDSSSSDVLSTMSIAQESGWNDGSLRFAVLPISFQNTFAARVHSCGSVLATMHSFVSTLARTRVFFRLNYKLHHDISTWIQSTCYNCTTKLHKKLYYF